MIVASYVLSLVGIVLAAAFLAVYTVTAWRPWERRRYSGPERAARQLLLSLPVMLVVLLVPGLINAAFGHTATFGTASAVVGKSIAILLMWFPWRLWWKARREGRS